MNSHPVHPGEGCIVVVVVPVMVVSERVVGLSKINADLSPYRSYVGARG